MRKKKIDQEPKLTTHRSIGEITEEAYELYGGYVSTSRALPRLDGLKPAVSRLLWSSMQFPKGKMQSALDIISTVTRYSPHGVANLDLTLSHLKRSGLMSGEGFFGYTSIEGVPFGNASPRYLHAMLSPLYWEMWGDVVNPEFVGFHVSPNGGEEPDYFPTPIPCCLFMPVSTTGISVGVKTDIPSFSAKSILAAYKANDPNLLEPSVDLLIDKKSSELERLWYTGKGRVVYAYKISRQKSPDGKTEGILFESSTDTSTEIFTPSLKKFDKLISEGKVYTEDLTDDLGPKLFIGRVPGARGVSIEEIEGLARKICYSAKEYQVWITDGTKAFRTPIKDWVDYTYKNYVDLIGKVNQRNIEKVQFQIAVQEALPQISRYLVEINIKASVKELSVKLHLPENVVEAALEKPLRQVIQNKDTTDRVKSLKAKLKELKKFDPVRYTEEIIMKL